MRAIVSKTTFLSRSALCLSVLSLAAATSAPAAAADPATPAAPAAPAVAPAATPSKGPLIAGVCLLSRENLIARSKVGLAATARLRELAAQAQANLIAEKGRLEARGKALEAKRATLTPLQLQAQGQALNQRAQSLQGEAAQRSEQIDATKTKVFNQVLQSAEPFVGQAYAGHGCGLLFARESVLSGNFGNDLTPEVIAAMDAKVTPITFDLEPPKAAK